MLLLIGAVLVVLWILGLAMKVAGKFVHLALLIGLVLIVLNFVNK